MAAAVSFAGTYSKLFSPVRVGADETWIAPPSRPGRTLYVPFWRVKIAVHSAILADPPSSIAIGSIEFPMPGPSFGGRAGVMMICARSAVPFTPRLPAFFGGTDALEVHRDALIPLTNERASELLSEGEIVDADVDRTRGEMIAADALVDLLRRPDGVRSIFRPRIESTMFVLYPLGQVATRRSLSERVRRFFNG